MAILHGYWEGWPTIVGEKEAWAFVNGEWKQVNYADAFTKASIVSKAKFTEIFGKLPTLPNAAFPDEDKEAVGAAGGGYYEGAI